MKVRTRRLLPLALVATAALLTVPVEGATKNSNQTAERDGRSRSEANGYDMAAVTFMGVGLAAACLSGVDGDMVVVPVLILVLGFDVQFVAASANFILMGGAFANVVCSFHKHHPLVDRRLVDVDLYMAMAPSMMGGAALGAFVSKLLPSEETPFEQQHGSPRGRTSFQELQSPEAEKVYAATITPVVGNGCDKELQAWLQAESKTNWKKHGAIVVSFLGILAAATAASRTECGSAGYWTLLGAEIPWVLIFTGVAAIALRREQAQRRAQGYSEVPGGLEWTHRILVLFSRPL